jgi:hypothetical protein
MFMVTMKLGMMTQLLNLLDVKMILGIIEVGEVICESMMRMIVVVIM